MELKKAYRENENTGRRGGEGGGVMVTFFAFFLLHNLY